MPDFHQPGPDERAEAEATGAAEEGAPPIPVDPELREERPSSRNDPNAPDRPET